ncbi:hypothetical protein HDU96_003737 [Phlyctochytrium bullatum]|nr:hypothetical protein HDU96_003737 [Phlyctochytrium bullatum]
MVKHIEQLSPDSVVIMDASITEIERNWPTFKTALEAKKGVDDAFASVIKHEIAAFDINKEINELQTKVFKKKKIAKLQAKMDHEFRCAATFEAQGLEQNERFLQTRASFDALETHIAAFLDAVESVAASGSHYLASRLSTIRDARARYDAAKAKLPRYSKAEGLVREILDYSKTMRKRLIEEYAGDVYVKIASQNTFDGPTDAYLDLKTQADAINTSVAVALKTQTVFELCPELPPHTIEADRQVDPDGPALKSRRRSAILTENAVKRLDAIIDNNEITLQHLQTALEQYRHDVMHDAEVVRRVSLEVWDATVGKGKGVKVRDWVPEIALNTAAFRLDGRKI